MVYPALLPLMRTPPLSVVDWTDAPADLNGLVRFAERRNLVSARVPSRFKRSLTAVLARTLLGFEQRGENTKYLSISLDNGHGNYGHLTPCSRILEKFLTLCRNCPHFMAPEGPSPRSQCPLLVHILSQIHTVEALPSYFLNICFNIINPSTPCLPDQRQ